MRFDDKPNDRGPSTQDSSDFSFLKDLGQAIVRPGGTATAVQMPSRLFCLPIQNRMVFPGLMAPLFVQHVHHIEILNKVISDHSVIGLVVPREDWSVNRTQILEKDIFKYGVAVKVIKKVNLPDEGSHILVQGLQRFRIDKVLEDGAQLFASVKYLEDKIITDQETEALSRALIYQVKELSATQPLFSEEMRLAMVNTQHPGELADLIAYTVGFPKGKLNRYISITNVKKRLSFILIELKREYELLELQKKIQTEVSEKVTKAQREYFLKEQLRQIQEELGAKAEDQHKLLVRFRERLGEIKLSKGVVKQMDEEIGRLESMNEMSPEYQVTRNYLEYVLYLPWGFITKDRLDMNTAKRSLDSSHYGLSKVKARILEFLAVRKLNPEYSGSILCFVGPPGSGKTSLGKSIAIAMGRKFFRFSLGGIRDEAEIKGHRKTYVGAMPGKIIQAMKRVGSHNPVILMDEIDKMGVSFQGDPASAMLEVLDPEQNQTFLDHYIDVPFDLSKVLFILTANVLENIPEPLVDRMEVIELHGYNEIEKQHIAKKFLIPKLLIKHGLKKSQFSISDTILKYLINDYAREAGVRYLDQCLANLMRKRALEIVTKPKKKKLKWTKQSITKILGPGYFREPKIRAFKRPGMAYGLAWTPYGGDILTIESLALESSHKKENYHITGQVGEVMSESAHIAYTYAAKYAKNYGAPSDFFDKHEIHLHIPSGAIPKDGPSAGVVMLMAMMSLATEKLMPHKYAMTGELSLSGQLLAIGGIKEKLLAARREGIEVVGLPKSNKVDVEHLDKESKKDIKLVYFDHVREVILYLFDSKMKKALKSTKTKSRKKKS